MKYYLNKKTLRFSEEIEWSYNKLLRVTHVNDHEQLWKCELTKRFLKKCAYFDVLDTFWHTARNCDQVMEQKTYDSKQIKLPYDVRVCSQK